MTFKHKPSEIITPSVASDHCHNLSFVSFYSSRPVFLVCKRDDVSSVAAESGAWLKLCQMAAHTFGFLAWFLYSGYVLSIFLSAEMPHQKNQTNCEQTLESILVIIRKCYIKRVQFNNSINNLKRKKQGGKKGPLETLISHWLPHTHILYMRTLAYTHTYSPPAVV